MEEWLAKPTDPHQFDRPTDLMHSTPYERWLAMTLDYIVNNTACSNPTQPESTRPLLSGFVLDLPFISERELMRLQQMCQDPTKITVAFSTLRDLTTMRPTLRNRTLDVLLGLSTHSRRQIRTAAIMSVKSWVSPNNTMNHLGERVVSFAVQLLQKLEKNEEDDNENNILDAKAAAAGDGTSKSGLVDQPTEVEMEDGETTELEAAGREMSPEPPVSFAKVQNAVILSGLRKVKTEDVVVQHLELLLALSAKNPDLIDQFSFFFLFLFLDICHHLGLNCLCFYLFVCDSPKNIHQLVPIISTDASPSPTIRQ
jgi:symplekin